MLSYYLDTNNTKPGWRPLKVKVHRPGTEVRARSGFFVTNATVNPSLAHQSDMAFALTSPFDSTGIFHTVHWKSTAADGEKKKVQFGLYFAPEGVTIDGEKNQLNLDIAVIALTAKSGTAADTFSQTLQGATNADTLAKLRAEGLAYSNTLELLFVVRDNPGGKVGSVTAPLTVN